MAKVVKDCVVDDVDSGEMTSDGEAEIVIVGEMVTVCKSRNYSSTSEIFIAMPGCKMALVFC